MKRTSKSFAIILASCVAVALLSIGCEKVPLRDVGQHLQTVNAHWFESEKTAYVFFEADAPPPSSSSAVFELNAGNETTEFRALSPDWSVHEHQIVRCGDHVCGSFSFKSAEAPKEIILRLRYHASSPLETHMATGVQTHPNDGTSQAYSALVYGVFSGQNDRAQLRIESNFGDPNSSDVAKYGMTRRFESVDEVSSDFTTDDESRLQIRTLSPFLYPADICALKLNSHHGGRRGPVTRVQGNRAWSSLSYDKHDTNAGSCFQVNTLDHNGSVLVSQFAVARKNPVLTQTPLKISTPLHASIKVPIVVNICGDSSGNPSPLSAPQYLDYQKHILGFDQATVDACFQLGQESIFSANLQTLLLQKLEAARAAAAGSGGDLFFTVILNHRLGAEFDFMQSIVQSRLNDIIFAEAGKISPRLVGAFVYDSNENFSPKATGNPALIWCPRVRQKSEKDNLQDGGVNCITDHSGGIDLTLLSAVAPMGPFPNLTSFETYVAKWGTGGLLKQVEFKIRSVPAGASTVQDSENQVTYFDSVRLSILPGHGARVCSENDDGSTLDSLRFLNSTSTHPYPLTAADADASLRVGNQSFRVGIEWEFPFLISVEYREKLSGTILGFVPFSATGKTNKLLGEPKWNRANWDLGSYFQKCDQFCDHPFFDSAGTYQVSTSWRADRLGNCPITDAPTPQ